MVSTVVVEAPVVVNVVGRGGCCISYSTKIETYVAEALDYVDLNLSGREGRSRGVLGARRGGFPF